MMEALGRLLADAGLRKTFGAAARRKAEGFGWDAVAARWAEVLLEPLPEDRP
jgi:glycosyltransferase involved in cell wall biosynthesis